MKERPILFSAPMVRALLNGKKTQTRRIVKPQPERNDKGTLMWGTGRRTGMQSFGVDGLDVPPGVFARCPYGKPGDRLWVREAWQVHTMFDHLPPRDISQSHVWYIADDGYKAEPRYRQGMFMPRWASRITLELTSVRVERLQQISTADALAEGVNVHPDHHGKPATSIYGPVQAYRDLWEQINGPDSWDTNPWVWVVGFRRLQ